MQNFMSKGMQWMGKLFGADLREPDPGLPKGLPPARIDRPVSPVLETIPADLDPTTVRPSSFDGCCAPPSKVRAETLLTDALRDKIFSCALLRTTVEKEMRSLCETFRRSMPPSRLQLWARSYSKGGRPAVLHWVSLSRKPERFDHATLGPTGRKRPRWFKILNIHNRTDLYNAIHWN